MRILIIARGYPSPKYPLYGIFEWDQAKALSALGHEVIVAALDMRSLRRWRHWGTQHFHRDGVNVEVLSLPAGNIPKPLLNSLRVWALRRLYSRIVKLTGKPDIIHSHFIELGYASTQVLNREGIPLIHTEHYSGMNQTTLSGFYQSLGSMTYPKLSQVIAVSHSLSDNLKSKFNITPIVIPNIIDLSQFNAEVEAKDDSEFTYISVGGLTPNKNMAGLIHAFHHAFNDNPNVRLKIIGEGTQRKPLEALIKQLNLHDQVSLMGLLDRSSIARVMRESHAFVLASKSETFGLAYIEAMAMGLPVIATKCGGPEDFVTPENGLLVEIDQIEELAQQLIFMKENIHRYDRQKIADTVRTRYSPLSIATQLNELYLSKVQSKI